MRSLRIKSYVVYKVFFYANMLRIDNFRFAIFYVINDGAGCMTKIFVREIRKEDIEDIIDILKSAKLDFPWGLFYNATYFDIEDIWDSYRGLKDYRTIVAEIDGKVVGFLEYFPHWSEKKNMYIELIITHKDYRGLGVGRTLIKHCLARAISKDYEVLSLHTWGSNRAVHLYRKTGFVWIPSTYVYMKNFSPRLFKYDELKKIFKNPESLIDCLVDPAQKILINDHVAWKYTWRIGEREIEAIFHSKTGYLMGLRIDNDSIQIRPPKNIEYIEKKNVPIEIITSSPINAYIDEKIFALSLGTNKVTIKAKKKHKFKIGSYDFGFGLRTINQVEIALKKHINSPSVVKVTLINNKEEKIKERLNIVAGEKLSVFPKDAEIEIPSRSLKTIKLYVDGEGEAEIRYGDSKEKIYVYKNNYVKLDKEEFRSRYWHLNVKEESISTTLIPSTTLWWMFCLGDEKVTFKRVIDNMFVAESKKAIIKLRPRIRGDELHLQFEVLAKENINDYFKIAFWIEANAEKRGYHFLFPTKAETFIRLSDLYPFFPRQPIAIRKKLPQSILGIENGHRLLLMEYDSDGLISIRSVRHIRIYYPIEIKIGETVTKDIKFRISKPTKNILGKKVVEPIEISLREDKIVAKNNWIRDIEASIIVRNKHINKKLKPGEEMIVLDNLKGLGKETVHVGIKDAYKKKTIRYAIPIKANWEDKKIFLEGLSVHLEDIGASIKSIKINNKEIIQWYDNPTHTSLWMPQIYGGITYIMHLNDENKDIQIKEWEYHGNGEFSINVDKIILQRKISILDNNTILDELEATNRDYKPKKVLIEYVASLKDKILWIQAGDTIIGNEQILSRTAKRKITIITNNGEIFLEILGKGKQDIRAFQLLDLNGFLKVSWKWNIMPKKSKKKRIILTIKEPMQEIHKNIT